MIIALFHVLYLFGKFVYQKYYDRSAKGVNVEAQCVREVFTVTEEDFKMIDPEGTQDYERPCPLRFSPPAYLQRYIAVKDILTDAKYHAKLRKIVDFGCSELGFLLYLKNVDGVEEILCVDIDRAMLEVHKGKAEPLYSEYLHTRATPLTINILEGSVTHNDKRLESTDAVVCIELIEHLYPETLTDFPYNVFGYIQPKVAVITTPNADFNVLFPNFSGFRHFDHKFEWTREQFKAWAENITLRYPEYKVTFHDICYGPKGTEVLGGCTQMAVFNRDNEKDGPYIPGVEGLFKEVAAYKYPFKIDIRTDEQKILDEASFYIRNLSMGNPDMAEEVPLQDVLKMLKKFSVSLETLRTILGESEWAVVDRDDGPMVLIPQPSSSDYSGGREDDFLSNFDDEWDDEPGPPIDYYYTQSVQQESTFEEQWDDETWNEEPSIVVPENNSFHQNYSYLYNGEQASGNWEDSLMDLEMGQDQSESIQPSSENTESASTGRELPSNSVSLALDQIDVDELDTSLNSNIPSSFTRSVALSSFPSSARSEEPGRSMSFSNVTESQGLDDQSITSLSMVEVSQIEDIWARMSVSCVSTSPPCLPIHTEPMDNSYNDNSMLTFDNNSMSNSHLVNSSFLHCDVDKDLECSLEDGNLEENIRGPSAADPLSSSYRNSQPLDNVSYVNEHTGTSCCSILKERDQLDGQCDMDNSISGTNIDSSTSDDEPQFTSSPRVYAKTSCQQQIRSTDIKKRPGDTSLIKKQLIKQAGTQSSHNEKYSANTSQITHQSCNNVSSESSTSSENSSIKKWFDEEDNSMYRRNCVPLKGGNEAAGNTYNYNVLDIDEQVLEKCSDDHTLVYNTKKEETMSLQSKDAKDMINMTDTNVKDLCSRENPLTMATTSIKETFDRKTVPLQSQEQTLTYTCAKEKRDGMSLCIDNDNFIQSTSYLIESEREAERNSLPKRENHSKIYEMGESSEYKPISFEDIETPPNSYSPEIMDSGYPNSASAQDMTTPEYDLSSIAHDRISDSESPSVAEAPRLGFLEPVEVENGDLANNNRDGEGNNMIAVENDDLDDLQPFIDVLENDLENENDIYVVQNGFPVWLLRILEMANPVDLEGHAQQRDPLGRAGRDFNDADRDEGFDSTSSENESDGEHDMRNAIDDDVDQNDNNGDGNETDSSGNSVSDWAAGDT